MTDTREVALAYSHENRSKFLDRLKELVAIPTVSTSPDHKADMLSAAEWLSSELKSIGFSTAVHPTPGHPVVLAELMKAGPEAKTVLIYGHYDVQPVEPIDLWKTGPFNPTQQDDRLHGRGASDMKGQIIASIKAVESVLKAGTPPVNFKFVLEGEEEIGSPNLPAFLREHAGELKADIVLNPDTGMISPEQPTVVYALRGLSYFELRVYGPEHDLHSGMFGGVVHNPAQALCELIAGMHDDQGCVTLPGFYDKVRHLSDDERNLLARLPMGEDFYLKQTGASALWGEVGYTPVERTGVRPTLEIHGLLSGFTGKGSKTVIPAWAMAKISTRLVPDQNPDEVDRQMRAFLEQHAPSDIRWELDYFGGGPAVIADLNLPETRALGAALETVWGVQPAFKPEGGSVPVVTEMQNILDVQSVLTGFGLPDDNVHAPNEKLHLPTWERGTDALIHFFYNLEGE